MNYLKSALLILCLGQMASCSHALHILSSIGAELGIGRKNENLQVFVEDDELSKKSTCLKLTSEILKEKYSNPREKFFKYITQSKIKEEGRLLAGNADLLINISYKLGIDQVLLLSDRDINLSENKLMEYFLSKSGKNSAFRNHLEAQKYILEQSPPISIESLINMNRKYTKKGIRRDNRITHKGKFKSGAGVYNLSDEQRKILISLDRNLIDKIERLSPYDEISQGELNHEILLSLAENSINKFNERVDKIIPLDRPENVAKFNELSSKLFLSLIKLYPFEEANYEAITDFVFKLIYMKNDLPSPRIFATEELKDLNISEIQKIVNAGFLNSSQIYEKFIIRLKTNLPLMNTPDLMNKVASHSFSELELKNISKFNNDDYLDEVRSFVRYVLREDPSQAIDIRTNPELFFEKSVASINSKISHQKKVTKTGLLSEDYIYHYRKTFFHNASAWSLKMERYYSDNLVWKPMENFNKKESIISLFKKHKSLTDSLDKIDEFQMDLIHGKKNWEDRGFEHYGFFVWSNPGKISSQLVLGMKESIKDIPLSHSKKLSLGGVDPDALMVVQEKNGDGTIHKSYVRDPEKPWTILIFEGPANLESVRGRSPASVINLLEP